MREIMSLREGLTENWKERGRIKVEWKAIPDALSKHKRSNGQLCSAYISKTRRRSKESWVLLNVNKT